MPLRQAYHALQFWEGGRWHGDAVLARQFARGLLDAAGRARATELFHGTLRRLGTLDALIDAFSRIRTAKMEARLCWALRLGVYQLCFQERCAPAAAVRETVDLLAVQWSLGPRRRKLMGLCNAVLRAVLRGRTEWSAGEAPDGSPGGEGDWLPTGCRSPQHGSPPRRLGAGSGSPSHSERGPSPHESSPPAAQPPPGAKRRCGVEMTPAPPTPEASPCPLPLAPYPLPRALLPRGDGRAWVFDRPVFADPEREPDRFFAQRHSLPEWLVARWRASPPHAARLAALAAAANARPALCLQVRVGRTAPAALRAALVAAGAEVEDAPPAAGPVADAFGARARSVSDGWDRPVAHAPGSCSAAVADASGSSAGAADGARDPPMLLVRRSGPVDALPGFAEGWFWVQDASAARAALLLDARPGERLLDACAAPGGKSCALARATGDGARIVALDRDVADVAALAANTRRLGYAGIRPLVGVLPGAPFSAPFDGVLLDVPCSNTGVLGRRSDARWRLDPASIATLAEAQQRLLIAAAEMVRPGGRLLYSTCSLEAEENEDQVRALCRRRPDFAIEEEWRVWPEAGRADGGYVARLRRQAK